MNSRQTRIYAPNNGVYSANLWAETMMARIITPLASHDGVSWVWVTRYSSSDPDFEDSDESLAPMGFFNEPRYCSLRFRYIVEPGHQETLEQLGGELVEDEGCWQADWREFDAGSLCDNRFLGSPRSDVRRKERLPLVMNYLESVTRLTLHALVPADDEGRFKVEENDHGQNPYNSAFFSLHHLFCNTTKVVLTALATESNKALQIGTRQYPPQALVDDPNKPFNEYPIRF